MTVETREELAALKEAGPIVMKVAVALALVAAVPSRDVRAAALDVPTANAAFGKLLGTYVTPRGVKYSAWRGSGEDLKGISAVVAAYRGVDAKTVTPEERKALYLNLYNAKVVEVVLQGNPKQSFRELSKGFRDNEIFTRKLLLLQKQGVSLNDLEERLRKEYADPRIHFALNCASRSCPPLRTEPYTPASVDTQLDDATRAFLADPAGVTVKRTGGKATLTVSKIFDWYADDFKASGGVSAFLRKYGPQEVVDALASGSAKIEYADYDWGLNAVQ